MSLSKVPGVEKSDVSLERRKATIVMSAGVEPDIERLKAAVVNAGFKPGKAVIKSAAD